MKEGKDIDRAAEPGGAAQSAIHLKTVTVSVTAVFLLLSVLCWLGDGKEYSDTERRPLAEFPELSGETVWSGDFMEDFEVYAQDHFPFREALRTARAVFCRGVFRRTERC